MLRAGTAVLLLVVLAPIALLHGQSKAQLWYQAYEAGVRDVARGAWDSAVQNLQAAKQAGPQPARRVIFYGDRVDIFNPDYYLGVAYLNLRRFADSDAAFERVRQANLIPANDKQYATFQTQASAAKGEIALAQAEDFLAKGNYTLATDAADRAVALGIARARAQDVQQRVASLQRLADAAGSQTPAPANTQPPAAPPSGAGLGRVDLGRADLGRADVAPNGQQRPASAAVPGTAAPSSSVAGVAPPSRPSPAIVQKNPVRQIPAVRPSALPADSERVGIAAFFTGRYDEAARALAVVTAGPQSSPRARFYLACSLAAQVLTGDRDQSEMTAARAELRQAGRLDQFTSDRRLISPRVLAALAIPQ